ANLGDKTHDTSGVSSSNPSGFNLAGSVTYTFYASSDCSGSPVSAGSGSSAGCESFTVDPAGSSTQGSVYDETAAKTVGGAIDANLGDKTHDTSGVSSSNPSGVSLA